MATYDDHPREDVSDLTDGDEDFGRAVNSGEDDGVGLPDEGGALLNGEVDGGVDRG